MAQRVVVRLTEWTLSVASLKVFLQKCEDLGVGPRGKVHYAVDDNQVPCFYVELPERAADALLRAAAGPRATKAQQAVSGQLTARKEAVSSGQKVPGHVPAVARGGKVLKTRKKTGA